MLVKLWMTRDVVTVGFNETIADAKMLLEANNIRRLLVVDDEGALVGVLTVNDILNALPSVIDANYGDSERALSEQAKTSMFMSRNTITAGPDDPLESLASLMLRNKISTIPIIDESGLVGIITESDIFKAFTEVFGTTIEGLRLEIMLENDDKAVYRVMEVLEEQSAEITALSLCRDFGQKRQLMTVRIVCPDKEKLIDELWAEKIQINSILGQDSRKA